MLFRSRGELLRAREVEHDARARMRALESMGKRLEGCLQRRGGEHGQRGARGGVHRTRERGHEERGEEAGGSHARFPSMSSVTGRGHPITERSEGVDKGDSAGGGRGTGITFRGP